MFEKFKSAMETILAYGSADHPDFIEYQRYEGELIDAYNAKIFDQKYYDILMQTYYKIWWIVRKKQESKR